MAVAAINLTRVSHFQRAWNVQAALQNNQLALQRVQTQLSTGLRFQQPSEDPLRASSVLSLLRKQEQLTGVGNNLDAANAVMTELESAAQDAVNALNDAHTLALQGMDDSLDATDRARLADLVDDLVGRLVSVGNRRHLNTYLFSGRTDNVPFALGYGGVIYNGDTNARVTTIDIENRTTALTVPGVELFGPLAKVQGVADLDPAVKAETRVKDLRGALGDGVTLGPIIVRADNEQVEIDLTGADTVGDVVDRLNASLPAGIFASIGPKGIVLSQIRGAAISVADVGGSQTAAQLGLAGGFSTALRVGEDLDPRLMPFSRLDDLRAGGGIDRTSTFVIENGGQSVTIDLSAAETIEDVLNTINGTNIGVWARIGANGNSLDIASRVSGTSLTIREDGGRIAEQLGIRSTHGGTTLAELNDGLGIRTTSGAADLRITTRNGSTVDVNLDGTKTIADVLAAINTAGAGRVRAALNTRGNGIQIFDGTTGGGQLAITALNDSSALRDLGLDVTAVAGVLTGRDVNPQIADSPFTALIELREGLVGDDRLTMQGAAERLERVLKVAQREQGAIAAQAKMMDEQKTRVLDESAATEVLISDARDVDFTEAVVRFQQLQTALSANMATAAQVLNLSILDYLR